MDQGSEIQAPTSTVCPPQGPFASMDDVPEARSGSHDDDPTDCDPDRSDEVVANAQ
jgi:hypothetical protein